MSTTAIVGLSVFATLVAIVLLVVVAVVCVLAIREYKRDQRNKALAVFFGGVYLATYAGAIASLIFASQKTTTVVEEKADYTSAFYKPVDVTPVAEEKPDSQA
jgi:hypothetical protein